MRLLKLNDRSFPIQLATVVELIIDSALRARITVFTLIKLCRRSGPAQGNSQISRTSTFSFLVTKLHSLLVSNSRIKHYGGGGEILCGWAVEQGCWLCSVSH